MNDSIPNIKSPKKIRFEKYGYYFFGLVIMAILGFWPTYFSKFFDGTANFNFYFHFHAFMASLWIALLIVQPILIKKKKLSIHKQIGKLSFIILPLFFISVILLKHYRIGGIVTEGLGATLWLQVKDLVIIGIMFTIAMLNKRNMQIHARAMISTGIVFIEPTLGRFIILIVLPEPNFILGLAITVAIMYILIISFIIIERKQTSGRWVFPLLLLLYLIFHYFIFFQVSFPFWDAFAKWFTELPLT
jgi:ABC-type xylose transport system permease subunit